MYDFFGTRLVRKRWVAISALLVACGALLGNGTAYGQISRAQVPGTERALAHLEEILSRPEFQWQEQQQTLLDRLWERLLPYLPRLIPDIGGGERVLIPLLAIAGLAAITAAFVYAFGRVGRDIKPDAGSGEGLPRTNANASERALQYAQRHSDKGDYRLALRYLYLSALFWLDARGTIEYDRSRTNREYLQSMTDHPLHSKTLKEIVDVFDRTWYGLAAPDAQTYAQFEALVQRLRKL